MNSARGTCRIIPGYGLLRLRELAGFDEQMVTDTHTATAIELLDRLASPVAGSDGAPWTAAALTASDRDRLLAQVYADNYGRKVQSTARCGHCASLFDLEFDIHKLMRVLDAPAPVMAQPLADGTFRHHSGIRFRLPTGEDEIAVTNHAAAEAAHALLQRCLVEDPGTLSEEALAAVEEAMEEVGPVLDLDLDAKCPECGKQQPVHFSVQFYLLRAIEQGWKQAAREVHLLARAYGWSLPEILDLPRSQRRTLVELIEAERSLLQRSRA